MINVDELVEQYDLGEITQGELFSGALLVFAHQAGDEVLAGFPREHRDAFLAWLDDQLRADSAGLWVSSSGAAPPDLADATTMAKDWLRRRRGDDAGDA